MKQVYFDIRPILRGNSLSRERGFFMLDPNQAICRWLRYLLFGLLFVSPGIGWTQVKNNSTPVNTLAGENPFMDASSNFGILSGVEANKGKGLVFPRTDLTNFTFITSAFTEDNFPTAFDGMIVYNIGTGQSVSGQGVRTFVTPGFYFFYNPIANNVDNQTITSGRWVRMNDSNITSMPSGAAFPTDPAPKAGDVFYKTAPDNTLHYYNGSQWVKIGGAGGTTTGNGTPTGTGNAGDTYYDAQNNIFYVSNGSGWNAVGGAVTVGSTLTGNGTAASPLELAPINPSTLMGNKNAGGTATPTALTVSEIKTMLSLDNIENIALSAWPGSLSLTTIANNSITASKINVTAGSATQGYMLTVNADGSFSWVDPSSGISLSSSSISLANGYFLVGTSSNTAGGTAKSNIPLSGFGTTSSTEFASVISDETGSGKLVFNDSPTLITPNLGAATASSVTTTGNLIVGGTASVTSVTATGSLTGNQLVSTVADGTVPLVVTSTTPVANLSIGGNAGTATNIQSGNAGDLLYQTASSTTAKLSIGSPGYMLVAGTSSPTWVSPSVALSAWPGSLSLTTIANNSITASKINVTAGSATQGYMLTVNADGSFSWVDPSSGISLSSSSISLANGYFLVGTSSNTAGGTAKNSIPLSGFGTTSSTEFASVISDETGNGSLVFSNSPTLVTPNLGAATASSVTTTGDLIVGGTVSVTSVTATGSLTGNQLVSTVADGTVPLVVVSKTPVANLSIGGNAGTATNIQDGNAGDLLYQTASSTTAKLSIGSPGSMLVAGTSSPTWVSPTVALSAWPGSLSLTTIADNSITVSKLKIGTATPTVGNLLSLGNDGTFDWMSPTGVSVNPASIALADGYFLVGTSSNTATGTAKNSIPLSGFGTTSSTEFASVISDETGNGSLVFSNSPTLVTPNLGAATASSVTTTGNLIVGGTASVTSGSLTIGQGNNAVTITAPTATAPFTLTLPTAGGSNGQVLKTDGSGVLSWTDAASGSVGTVTGTANEITVSGTTTTVTVSIADTYTGQSSINTVGNITTGTWSATTIAVAHGGTGLSSTTANRLLYSSAANTISELTSANNGILVTNSSGVPSIGNVVGAALTMPSITLSNSSNQLVFANGTNTGTITWGLGGTRTITLPDQTGTLMLAPTGSPNAIAWVLGGNTLTTTAVLGAGGTNTNTISIQAGTGTLGIGDDAYAQTINVGTGAGVVKTVNIGGTGANVIKIGDAQNGGSLSLGSAMTSGTISIGGSTQTGTIDIGKGTGAQTLNFGTGTGAKTINIGTGAVANAIAIGNTTGTTVIDLTSGTGGINLNTGTSTSSVTIGGSATQTISIGNGAAPKTVNVGSNNSTSTTTILSGTGGLHLNDGGTATVTIGSSTSVVDVKGTLRLSGSTSGSMDIKAPASVTSYALTLPSAITNTAGSALISDVSGNLTWGSTDFATNGTADGQTVRWTPGTGWVPSSVLTVGTSTDVTVANDLFVNGNDIKTNTADVATIFNTKVSQLAIGGASTATTIGNTSSGTTTIGYDLKVSNDLTVTGNDITFGNSGAISNATAGTVTITAANAVVTSADLTVAGNDINGVAGNASVFNTNVGQLLIGGAATSVTIGGSTGTATVNGDLKVSGNDILFGNGGSISNANSGTVSITATTVATSADMVVKGSMAVNASGATATSTAVLDISSTDKGILIPRMTEAQKLAIGSPANGLMVYVTTDNMFYYYKAGTWTQIGAGTGGGTASVTLSGDITGTATSTAIASGAIVNADVNASAAIDGTKIKPAFGAQTLELGTATATVTSTAGAIAFHDGSNTSTSTVTLKGPSGAVSSSYDIQLPVAAPTAVGQVLSVKTAATGETEWATPTGGGGGGFTSTTLTGDVTINQGTNTVTFTTGTGKFKVDGNFQATGAVYAHFRQVTSATIDWQSDDYLISVKVSGSQNINLPSPGGGNAGRIVGVRNDSVSGGSGGTYTFTTHKPIGTANSTILMNRANFYISDGSDWYPFGY